MNKYHNIVPNIKFGSLLLLLILHFITIISTQASQSFDKPPDGEYQRLKDQSLDIPCIVRNRQGECLWIKDGIAIGNIANKYEFERQPRDGDCSLRIQNLNHKTDEGYWECQVTSPSLSESSLKSGSARVVVLMNPNPPIINGIDNAKLRVQSDRNQQIECVSFGGNPAPRIEWYISGENVTQNSRTNVDSNTSDTPRVTSILSHTFKRSHRNATISCISVHPIGSQNTSTIIDVLYPPQVTVDKKTYTVNEKSSLRVHCIVDANPNVQPIWENIDGKVDNNDYYTETNSNVLYIQSVTKKMDQAQFACSARNEHGSSEKEKITLDVLYEPTLEKSSSGLQNVELGGTIDLFCDFKGNPKPKIMWYHINPITDQVRNRNTDEGGNRNIEEENQSKLLINNVTYHDEGHYYCEALNHNSITNKDVVMRSSKMVVDVFGKPSIIQKSEVTIGYRGIPKEIEQVFCSDPPPTVVYWKFGSIRIDVLPPIHGLSVTSNPSQNLTKTLRHKARPLSAMDKHGQTSRKTCFKTSLSIENTDMSDEREYSLVVENSKGEIESIVKLKVFSQVSAAVMITIGLVVLIMLLALTLVTVLVIKRRKLAKEKSDDESKAEVRAPMKSDTDKPEKEPEKTKGDNHELVYANLDFAKSEPKPTKAAKPTAQQRQHKTNGGNSGGGTEYAQITFANKADL